MSKLKILVLAAHPDDAEVYVAGLLCIYRSLGHEVKIISLTNGNAGHYEMDREELAKRRSKEGKVAAASIGATFEAWLHPDGELSPTIEIREQVIRELREYAPDLVLTHRFCDYHPDHRAVGQLVQDAAYLFSVPKIVPEVEVPSTSPIVAYMPDLFTRPYPLDPHVIVDITPFIDQAVRMLACHESQVFEWLPYNQKLMDTLPESYEGKLKWLRDIFDIRRKPFNDRYKKEIEAVYGEGCLTRSENPVELVEILELSEYSDSVLASGEMDPEVKKRLFPFLK